jgi:hypothetical protein
MKKAMTRPTRRPTVPPMIWAGDFLEMVSAMVWIRVEPWWSRKRKIIK